MRTRLHFCESLNQQIIARHLHVETSIILYDKKLIKAVPSFRRFIKNYPYAFAVQAGEGLKTIGSFQKVAERIHRKVGGRVTRDWTVVGVGGGSIGDFAGFFASVYKRGLHLVHIPTTWLAAIDSSHGAKTALNLIGGKNQIGTFWSADDCFVVRELLLGQNPKLIQDAVGELAKIALIDGGPWARSLGRNKSSIDRAVLWNSLRPAIAAKRRIVRLDPDESRGHRQILNLGHTLGHVIEAHQGRSHGESVGLGLLFAVQMSVALNRISPERALELEEWLNGLGIDRNRNWRPLPRRQTLALLLQDKKRAAGDELWFVTLRGWGRPERIKVPVALLADVATQNGWMK